MIQLDNHYIRISTATIESKLTKKNIEQIVQKLLSIQKSTPTLEVLMIINQEAICSLNHLEACIHYSLKSFKQKTNIANNLGPELLLYLAGRRQINKAIKSVGLTPKTERIMLIEIYNSQKSIKTFDLEKELQAIAVKITDYQVDINEFKLGNFSILKRNLGITDDMISLLKSDDSDKAYFEAIEKLAIERSAILNLQK